MVAVIVVGALSLVVGAQVGLYLAGLVVYAVAAVAGFAIYFRVRYSDSLAIRDEREAELERRASHMTAEILGYGSAFAFIALFVLDAAGRPSVGPTVETLLWAFAAFALTWAAVYGWLRYR